MSIKNEVLLSETNIRFAIGIDYMDIDIGMCLLEDNMSPQCNMATIIVSQ